MKGATAATTWPVLEKGEYDDQDANSYARISSQHSLYCHLRRPLKGHFRIVARARLRAKPHDTFLPRRIPVMRKSASSIPVGLFLLSSFLLMPAAQGAKAPQGESLSAWSSAPEPSFRRGNLRIDAETGVPLALYHVGYEVSSDTPEAMARQYLRDNAGLLHLGAHGLSGPEELVHHATRESGAGVTVRFHQYFQKVPVYDSEVAVTINHDNVVTFVMNGFKSDIELASISPSLSLAAARTTVVETLGVEGSLNYDRTSAMIFRHEGEWRLALVVRVVPSTFPIGDWEGFVDAHSGELLRLWDRSLYVDGTGNVFDPDPLSSAGVTYGTAGYVDGSDADTAELDAELSNMTLLDITDTAGNFSLVGPWAEIRDTESPFKGLFSQPSSAFTFTRTADGFEAAHTYFHIDNIMRYLNVTLGLTIEPFQYSGGARFDPHGLGGADNSHYIGATGEVAFGEGGVDDAEDADVVIHELGHALHDWVTSGGLSQVNGLSEGIGDFVASSYSRSLGHWTPADPQYFWVFDWDGHNPFWGGRITNYGAVWPGGLVNQVHTDGQIWASCMMRIWDAIGRDQTERAHWTGIGMTSSGTNQQDAAIAVLQAATDMAFPFSELDAMATIFQSCGYGVTSPSSAFFADGFETGDTTGWTATFP